MNRKEYEEIHARLRKATIGLIIAAVGIILMALGFILDKV